VYDTSSSQRITSVARTPGSPRADLFKPTLHWTDDSTLLIAWADVIKRVRIRTRDRHPRRYGEVTDIFQVDCMISGIAPHSRLGGGGDTEDGDDDDGQQDSFLVLAYLTEDTFTDADEMTSSESQQKRKPGARPELRVISSEGEELSSDVLALHEYARFGCSDYSLRRSPEGDCWFVISPKDIVVARNRDARDHLAWLIEKGKYEDALRALDVDDRGGFDKKEIGTKFLDHLVQEGESRWIIETRSSY
jgi:hypothetical protein